MANADAFDPNAKHEEAHGRRSFAPLLAAAATAVVLMGVVLAMSGGDDGYLQPPIVASAIERSATDVMSELSELAANGKGTGIGPNRNLVRVARWSVLSEGIDATDSGGLAWTESTPARSELPDDPTMIGPYLDGVTGIAHPSAADYVAATRELLTQNVLTAAQESALLGFLAQEEGLEVLGTTTDRAGREAAMFRAVGDSDASYLLLVSTTTGAILGVERVNAGAAVTEFTLWER